MEHQSVLLEEAVLALNIKSGGNYLDCTFGRGGHSEKILSQLDENGRLLALDRDLSALSSTQASRLRQDLRFKLCHQCFSELESEVTQVGWLGRVDGVLLDLGVSSPQLDQAERGFSFQKDGPLDMRMDTSSGLTAAEWLASVDEKDLIKVLFEFGEERFARKIARKIIDERVKSPIETTGELAQLIKNVMPVHEKHKHPATRTFQAIRIEINKELEEIQKALHQAVRILKPKGRLVVISFHSLEDRIVKRFIRNESGAKFNPGKLPLKESEIEQGVLKKIGKAVKASEQEILNNPRARSAIMRIAERV